MERQVCPACDGAGDLMHQWGKEAMLRCGGSTKPFSDGRSGVYYVDAEGKEIGLKTIGGVCSVCRGQKMIPVIVEDLPPPMNLSKMVWGGTKIYGHTNFPPDKINPADEPVVIES